MGSQMADAPDEFWDEWISHHRVRGQVMEAVLNIQQSQPSLFTRYSDLRRFGWVDQARVSREIARMTDQEKEWLRPVIRAKGWPRISSGQWRLVSWNHCEASGPPLSNGELQYPVSVHCSPSFPFVHPVIELQSNGHLIGLYSFPKADEKTAANTRILSRGYAP